MMYCMPPCHPSLPTAISPIFLMLRMLPYLRLVGLFYPFGQSLQSLFQRYGSGKSQRRQLVDTSLPVERVAGAHHLVKPEPGSGRQVAKKNAYYMAYRG